MISELAFSGKYLVYLYNVLARGSWSDVWTLKWVVQLRLGGFVWIGNMWS